MASTFPITVNCAGYADKNTCEDVKDAAGSVAICANGTNVGTDPCKCDAAYGDASGATSANSQCTKADLTCAKLGQAACGQSSNCKYEGTACICDPAKHLVADNTKGGECVCDTANHFILDSTGGTKQCVCDEKNGFTLSNSGSSCECGLNYQIVSGACTCPKDKFKEVTISSKKACVEIDKAPCEQISETDCTGLSSCKVDNNKCVCADGYALNDTSKFCEKSGSSSSASPLAILIICSLIISIIASIATAAVMIRRKATNARAAEAIVSDAL